MAMPQTIYTTVDKMLYDNASTHAIITVCNGCSHHTVAYELIPLFVRNGRTDVLRYLFANGYDPRAERDIYLNIAVYDSVLDSVRMLVTEYGCDPLSKPTYDDQTIINMAAGRESKKVYEFLCEKVPHHTPSIFNAYLAD